MRFRRGFAAACSLALLAAACEPPSVRLDRPVALETGSRLVRTVELQTEPLDLDLTLDSFTFDGEMEIWRRERLEVEVVSESELRLLVREEVTRTGLTLAGEVLPSKTVHGPLEGRPMVAHRREDGWEVAFADGEPTAAERAKLLTLSASLTGTSYPSQELRPGDEAEIDASVVEAALGSLGEGAAASGTVRLEAVETRRGVRGAALVVTFYMSGAPFIPGFDDARLEMTMQGDVFRSLDHHVDLDYTLAGELALDGSIGDARGSARLHGAGMMTVTGHTEIEPP